MFSTKHATRSALQPILSVLDNPDLVAAILHHAELGPAAFVAVASKQELLEIERSDRYEGVLPWEDYCTARFPNERSRAVAARLLGLSWCQVFYLLLILSTPPIPTPVAVNNFMIDNEQANSRLP